MLAARTAWAILGGEHAQLRGLVMELARAAEEGGWTDPGPAQARLHHLLVTLQGLDVASHRPKGITLTQALAGRSADADRLLATLRHERERDDALLGRALDLMDELRAGSRSAAAEFADVVARLRDGMLRQLEQEDTLLRRYAERLLTDEEWSRVASSISSALYVAAAPAPAEDRDP